MLWGENRGKWKGQQSPGIEPRTPLACTIFSLFQRETRVQSMYYQCNSVLQDDGTRFSTHCMIQLPTIKKYCHWALHWWPNHVLLTGLLAIRLLFRWIFMCSGSHVKVYSYSSREVVLLLSHHTQNVTALALNPRNRMQVHREMKNGSPDNWMQPHVGFICKLPQDNFQTGF